MYIIREGFRFCMQHAAITRILPIAANKFSTSDITDMLIQSGDSFKLSVSYSHSNVSPPSKYTDLFKTTIAENNKALRSLLFLTDTKTGFEMS